MVAEVLFHVPCNGAGQLEANADFIDLYLFLDFAEREQEEEEAREGREIFEKEGLQVLDVAVGLHFFVSKGCFPFLPEACTF
jgi:hypothetical protein